MADRPTVPKSRTVKKKVAAKTTMASKALAGRLVRFLTLKVQNEAIDEEMGEIKKALSAVIEETGYTDDKGSLWLDLDEPVEVEGYGKVTKLKRERRVSNPFDADTAEALLKKKGLYDECTVQITVLDEEAIERAYFQKRLTKGDIDKMYPAVENWAFKPIKGR